MKQAPTIKIAVASHKPYRMPEDDIYQPIHVGRALHLVDDRQFNFRFIGDDTGENISTMNPFYSELTAMFWMWKNCSADYKGLVHYRRHFGTKNLSRRHASDRFDRIAVGSDFLPLVNGQVAAILPVKRNYYIETMQSHWDHTMPAEQLQVAKDVVVDLQPAYMPAFQRNLSGTSAHIFNMCVMRADVFDGYCEWLFPILAELTARLDPAGYNQFLSRYPGRISELLLDAWVFVSKINYAELPTVSPEPIDWPKKTTSFLTAKFQGKKYENSF